MTQSPGGDNTSSNSTRGFVEPAQNTEKKREYRFERGELRSLCQATRRVIYPEIKMNQHRNAEYSPSKILDVLTHVAPTNDFTNNGTKTYGILDEDSPHPNSILYRVRKLELQEILNQFNSAVESTIREAKKRGMLRGRIDLAIDITEWLYYGDENEKTGDSEVFEHLVEDLNLEECLGDGSSDSEEVFKILEEKGLGPPGIKLRKSVRVGF